MAGGWGGFCRVRARFPQGEQKGNILVKSYVQNKPRFLSVFGCCFFALLLVSFSLVFMPAAYYYFVCFCFPSFSFVFFVSLSALLCTKLLLLLACFPSFHVGG